MSAAGALASVLFEANVGIGVTDARRLLTAMAAPEAREILAAWLVEAGVLEQPHDAQGPLHLLPGRLQLGIQREMPSDGIPLYRVALPTASSAAELRDLDATPAEVDAFMDAIAEEADRA